MMAYLAADTHVVLVLSYVNPGAVLRASLVVFKTRYHLGTVKLAESRLGRSRVGQVNGRDEDPSRPDLRRPSLPC